jgi:hypothetical protein
MVTVLFPGKENWFEHQRGAAAETPVSAAKHWKSTLQLFARSVGVRLSIFWIVL